MIELLEELKEEALKKITASLTEAELRDDEVHYLGKKGAFTKVMQRLKDIKNEDRPKVGAKLNAVKVRLSEAIEARRALLVDARLRRLSEDPYFDASLNDESLEFALPKLGTLHPLTQMIRHIEDVFSSMGFMILDYPELESEFFNFDALNIPETHPARDMQDTFWVKTPKGEERQLLRTHTSTGQVRTMQAFEPPFRAIFPGRVFRFEEVDASHEHSFHQVEGLMIDRKLSVANLIFSMKTLLSEIFERDVKVRLRPGFFPFVEPGFELDISCQVCEGKGCSVCKNSGWLELLPCGLVHPNVLRHGGLDPEKWQGWAFGLGLSRLVMMRYQIEDIRHLMSGDLRFNQQFRQG